CLRRKAQVLRMQFNLAAAVTNAPSGVDETATAQPPRVANYASRGVESTGGTHGSHQLGGRFIVLSGIVE
ncbi:MAG TPA: hypothetical protein VKK79_11660, partial [Candidatus Lokiarchaeia archaeon]|nr:hypothetical protein [Candidatus Lokiarchaeia archaeon]